MFQWVELCHLHDGDWMFTVYKCSCFSWGEINSWDGRVVMGTGPLEGIVTILLVEPHVSSSDGSRYHFIYLLTVIHLMVWHL